MLITTTSSTVSAYAGNNQLFPNNVIFEEKYNNQFTPCQYGTKSCHNDKG